MLASAAARFFYISRTAESRTVATRYFEPTELLNTQGLSLCVEDGAPVIRLA
jgi:hypothetical protein